MKKILVTGGAGFIGSHVIERLAVAGYEISVLDNLSTGKKENIQSFLDSGAVELMQGDIRDRDFVNHSLKNVDAVIHLAALVSVPLSIENPDLTFDINLAGTLNLLRSAVENSARRFIFISSCAVCGDPQTLPVTEATDTNPISPYAESKLIGERYTLGFSERDILPSVVLRFFNVYGPRQGMNNYSGVITRFIDSIKKKSPIVIYGDGLQTRDFVNVEDISAAVLAALQSSVKSEIFNVGSGKPTTINELASTLLELAGAQIEVRHENARAGDIKDSYADISKAKTLLGYEPEISLCHGLEKLLASSLDK